MLLKFFSASKRTNSLFKLRRIKSGQHLLHKTKGLYFYKHGALNAEQYTAQKLTACDKIFILFEFLIIDIYVETIVLLVFIFFGKQTNRRQKLPLEIAKIPDYCE